MSEAPPQAGSDTSSNALTPPTFMAPPDAAGEHDTMPIDVPMNTVPVRIARFDQEHPAGTPDTGPIQGLTPDPEPSQAPGPPEEHRADALESGLSRRNLLLYGAAGAAAAGGAGTVVLRSVLTSDDSRSTLSDTLGGSRSPIVGTPKAPAAVVPGGALALPKNLSTELLLRRVTYGLTTGLEDDVARAGAQKWLAGQLDPRSVKDPDGDAVGRLFPDLSWSTEMVRSRLSPGDDKMMNDLGAAHVGRAVWSSRQLFEVLVDFWSNHLNVPSPRGDVWDTRHRYDADVIRRHTLGRFEEMLVASAVHPAMLTFLDAGTSAGDKPNENYARELLEQHTVGVDAGYDEGDVRRAALLFTGWKVEGGQAVYDLESHWTGEVRVMRFTHPNATAAAGRPAQLAFLQYLANHPRTARTVARKLAVRFVADDPPDSLVERLAQVYTTGGTAILPVLRALFSSPEFADSAGRKIRRPFERLAATVRTLDADVPEDRQGLVDLYAWLGPSGHLPLAWPRADGYPDVASAWVSPAAALEQLNTVSSLVHAWWPTKLGLRGPRALLQDPPGDRNAVIEAVARRVLGRAPTPAERSSARTLLSGTRLPASFADRSWEQEETIALVATLFLLSPSQLSR
jgi:uncharacterized protein (DUF1800 family)